MTGKVPNPSEPQQVDDSTPIVAVRYDRTTQLQLAAKAPSLAESLALQITDQQSLEFANQLIAAANQWIKAVDAIMDPVRDATHVAWKAAIRAQDDFKRPVEAPLAALKKAAVKFIADAQAEHRRLQEEKDRQQRAANEAEARRKAQELRTMGATRAEVAEIKQAILQTPAVQVAPAVEVPKGQTQRHTYSAELTDVKEFFRYLLSGTDNRLYNIITGSEKVKAAIVYELGPEAVRAGRNNDQYEIPGTRLVKTPHGAWRR